MRLQNLAHCASITYMIRHYVARRAKVIEDHPHNADDRMGRVFRLGQRLNSPISFLPHRVRLVRAHVVPPGNAFADLAEAARIVQLFAFPRRVQDGVLPPGRASGGADSV